MENFNERYNGFERAAMALFKQLALEIAQSKPNPNEWLNTIEKNAVSDVMDITNQDGSAPDQAIQSFAKAYIEASIRWAKSKV